MKNVFLSLVFCSGFFLSSCHKSSSTQPAGNSTASTFSFTELKASVNPVQQSQVSNITATASGSNLSYSWSASHGDIFGNGAAIMYSTAPCCVGTHTITCIVSNGSSSQTKTLVMTVTN